jgi:hypothetical protein
MNNLVLEPILPVPVIVILAVLLCAATVWSYIRSGQAIERWRNVVLLVFRLAGVALVLALLLQPSRQEFIPPPSREKITLVGVDTSRSMKQRDAEGAARLDAAKNLLASADVINRRGEVENARLRLFQFNEDATPVTESALDLTPAGKGTRINKSVITMLNSGSAGSPANALILLTDGHDFEMVNPVKTGSAARARGFPIYAIPFGRQGKVRDVSVRITSFQPYCYVKQKARITAAMRLIGCEFEDITVQLLRHGTAVQTRRVNAAELQEATVEFDVVEPEVGQFEYEVRAEPLEHEVDPANNSAITYLNVIDQQIKVLVVEGDPYWDTTFLQRSLMRNDKFEVDALVRYARDKVRAIRKTEAATPLRAPTSLDELSRYDVVILGRNVDQVLGANAALLDAYVKDRSGAVIFGRGRAFSNPAGVGDLEPVLWGDPSAGQIRLDVTPEGRGLTAFRGLNDAGGFDTLPHVVTKRSATESKPLTSTLAVGTGESGDSAPAIVHRRYGRGQVVSVGVEGLWRWGLNAKADGPNTAFDKFWDQTVLWLLAGRDFIPTRRFSFRPNSANVLLGEKVSFRVRTRQPEAGVKSVPLTLFFGDSQVGRINMTAGAGDPDRLSGEYVPERVGRYRAVAQFPDGTSQESRFIVYTENLEETEVATDVVGLRRLCESSGGRLIDANDLAKLLQELDSQRADTTPKIRLIPVWNEAWVFYLAGLLFGLDWFLRRRWGLC